MSSRFTKACYSKHSFGSACSRLTPTLTLSDTDLLEVGSLNDGTIDRCRLLQRSNLLPREDKTTIPIPQKVALRTARTAGLGALVARVLASDLRVLYLPRSVQWEVVPLEMELVLPAARFAEFGFDADSMLEMISTMTLETDLATRTRVERLIVS